jgi:hypothetical protein
MFEDSDLSHGLVVWPFWSIILFILRNYDERSGSIRTFFAFFATIASLERPAPQLAPRSPRRSFSEGGCAFALKTKRNGHCGLESRSGRIQRKFGVSVTATPPGNIFA